MDPDLPLEARDPLSAAVVPDFRLLFESARGLCLVLAPDAPRYTIIAVSDAYAHARKSRREDLIGRGLFEVSPDDPSDPSDPSDPIDPSASGIQNTAASLQRVLATRAADQMTVQRYDFQERLDPKAAFEERWWSRINSPVFRPDGSLACIVHRVEDVTASVLQEREQKASRKVEAELRSRVDHIEAEILERVGQVNDLNRKLLISNARLTGTLSISTDAIISVSEAGLVTMFNEGAEKIFGYSKEEALGETLDRFIPASLRESHRGHVETFANGAVSARAMAERSATVRGVRRDGSEFPADAAISKFVFDGQKTFTVILRDVTEQRRHESELEFLEEMGTELASTLDLETILTTIARMTVRDLADVCIVSTLAPDGSLDRFKVVSGDPLKSSLCERLMANPLDRTRPQIASGAYASQRPVIVEKVTPDILASYAHSEDHLQALRALDPKSIMNLPMLAQGQCLGTISLLSCSPSRTFGPADLRVGEAIAWRAALSILSAVHYRTAQRAVNARDRILGVVAHDLRNPLGNILLQMDLLKALGVAERSREVIRRAVGRIDALIQDLLDVTRMEAGQFSIEPAVISSNQVVLDAARGQEARARAGRIELSVELPALLPDIRADRDRVLQVFENLIGNALKFTRPGGSVRIGAAGRDPQVLFWVSDSGTGIAPENLPHVWDRFWQGKKADRAGAGLGLNIAKTIVEAHGGRIWVESDVGTGSTFFFTIPVVTGVI